MQRGTPGRGAGQETRGVVLLMDDDDMLREALRDVLEQRGYDVEACADAAEGLMRLHAGLTPQVIVLDLRTPGIDGWEFRLIQKADQRWSEIPLIAVSGDTSPKAASIDAEAFLSKPLDDRKLLQTVERMVRLGDQRAGAEYEGEREFFVRHRPWQLRAPFRASDVRELIEAQWRSFH